MAERERERAEAGDEAEGVERVMQGKGGGDAWVEGGSDVDVWVWGGGEAHGSGGEGGATSGDGLQGPGLPGRGGEPGWGDVGGGIPPDRGMEQCEADSRVQGRGGKGDVLEMHGDADVGGKGGGLPWKGAEGRGLVGGGEEHVWEAGARGGGRGTWG